VTENSMEKTLATSLRSEQNPNHDWRTQTRWTSAPSPFYAQCPG